MQYLVFSDIHGNADALERVINEIRGLRPDVIVSLGDVVGYGANPGECVGMVEEVADLTISGNHDLAAAGIIDYSDFNSNARRAISWTESALSPADRFKLENYDPIRRYGDCIFAHATPVSPLDWDYIYTVKQARRVFDSTAEKFLFIGHTHIPGIITFDDTGTCRVERRATIDLQPGCRYLVNVGSIGQPRDGINAASYVVLDLSRKRLSIKRVPYNIRAAQEKIRTAGLPESLAARLVTAT